MIFDYKNIKALNKTEATIYNYIIHNMDRVVDMNVRELAEKTFVSTATIVRFTRKMGCDGFNELKEELRQNLSRSVLPDPDEQIDELIRQMNEFRSEGFKKNVHKFAMYISHAKMLIFIGEGNKGAIARYAARYFSNIGYFAIGVDDPYYPPVVNKGTGTVVVVFSESGETSSMIDQVNAYKANDACVLTITNNRESTIAEMSDWYLFYTNQELCLPVTYDLSTSVPLVYIIEATARDLQKATDRMSKLKTGDN
ncbi:MAG: MurR/RpiR family transcriptional regulator [Bulleidia sp.]